MKLSTLKTTVVQVLVAVGVMLALLLGGGAPSDFMSAPHHAAVQVGE